MTLSQNSINLIKVLLQKEDSIKLLKRILIRIENTDCINHKINLSKFLFTVLFVIYGIVPEQNLRLVENKRFKNTVLRKVVNYFEFPIQVATGSLSSKL